MKSSRSDMLKQLKMPKKSAPERDADMDLESLGMEDGGGLPEEEGMEHEAMESPEFEAGEQEGMMEAPELDHLTDAELLSELKKRGLMAKSSPIGEAAEADLMSEEPAPKAKGMK